MPANKTNYLVFYVNSSQVYGAGSKEIALQSPPPAGSSLEDKRILFITYQPDTSILAVQQVPQEEVLEAEIKEKKAKNGQAEADSTSAE